MKLNQKFNISEYTEAYEYVTAHKGTYIKDLGNSQYQICKSIEPTKEELNKIEQEIVSKLSLSKREVFLGLYRAKQIKPEEIRSQLTDEEAIIEFDYAERYYRGNPLINQVGEKLGITSNQLDNFFKTNDYKELIK